MTAEEQGPIPPRWFPTTPTLARSRLTDSSDWLGLMPLTHWSGKEKRNRGASGGLEAPKRDLGEALGKASPGPPPPQSPCSTHSPRRMRGTWKDTTASFWRTTNSKGAPFCLLRTFTDTRTPSVCSETVMPQRSCGHHRCHQHSGPQRLALLSLLSVLPPSWSGWEARQAPSSARAAPGLSGGCGRGKHPDGRSRTGSRT